MRQTCFTLILLPYVKNSTYSIADNNSNTSSDNSESKTKLFKYSGTFWCGAKKKSQW